MAGHSHWKQIKEQKGAEDVRRGKIFSKLLAAVTLAARANPHSRFNPRLKAAVERAQEHHVPLENIERAIKRSAAAEQVLEEVVIEAYGPEGVAIIIEAITNNKNRTVREIKHLLAEGGAKAAGEGGALWAFEKNSLGWHPKFPQQLSPASREELGELIARIENHPDIQRVATNATAN